MLGPIRKKITNEANDIFVQPIGKRRGRYVMTVITP